MDLVFTPTDFVAIVNQTFDYAYPVVTIEGELANVKISRGKWVYFDIKDEFSSVKCFGTVYMLPGPIEEGMMVRVVASPRLHPQYNFSLNLQSVTPIGEGSLKRASDLLLAKLTKEGLFDESRKRFLPHIPARVGLITSCESAAYADFIKILNERWGGVQIVHADVLVQGEQAIADIVHAIDRLNQLALAPEVIVITRGGGSADDLAAFSSEQVVRAVASSRVPTLIAIGHEVDISLAELAADRRASTPSNAAQLIVPDKKEVLLALKETRKTILQIVKQIIEISHHNINEHKRMLHNLVENIYVMATQTLGRQTSLLEALNPINAIKRGYAVIRINGKVIKSIKNVSPNAKLSIQLHDGTAHAIVNEVE